MPRILTVKQFKDNVDDLVEKLCEQEDADPETIAVVIPDTYGASFYSHSNNDSRDRLHVRLAYGEKNRGVRSDMYEKGVQGIGAGGIRGAFVGLGLVTLEELGPEAKGVHLENLGRVPDPHFDLDEADDSVDGRTESHMKHRDESSSVEGDGIEYE